MNHACGRQSTVRGSMAPGRPQVFGIGGTMKTSAAGHPQYDRADQFAAVALLKRMNWNVKLATDLLIFVDGIRDVLDTTSSMEETSGIKGHGASSNGVAQHGAGRHDAFGFYLGDSSACPDTQTK